MATKANGARNRNTNNNNSGSVNSSWIPPPMVSVSPQVERDLGFKYLGWLAACVLLVILLPITGLLYSKLYETKIDIDQSIKNMDRLKQDIEKLRKELNDKNSRTKLSI